MIVNVCGTSGSGKSTVVREVLQGAGARQPVHEEERAAPVGYDVRLRPGFRLFRIVGAYEAPSSGGCDTFGGEGRVERLYAMIAELAASHPGVLYEGITMMNHTRGLELVRRFPGRVHVARLDTPLEECKRRINARRAELGKEPWTHWENVQTNYVRAQNYSHKLKQLGALVRVLSVEDATAWVRELLS